METLVKWLGICLIAVAVAILTFPRTHPAPQLDLVSNLFPGLRGNEDLTAWVVESNRDAAPETFSRPSVESRRSVANRNRNPLNIKLGWNTRRYVEIGLATVSAIIPQDGGRFLKFASPETGFKAAVGLLSAPGYDDLRLDRALRRWSNNGYGAEILVGGRFDAEQRVPNFGRDDLKTLLNAMAAAEGYRSATIAAEIEKALTP